MSVDVEKATQEYFKSRRPMHVPCQNLAKKKCWKYVQPRRPEPFKPDNRFLASDIPLEANTIHILSYQPYGPNTARACRPDPVIPPRGVINNDTPLEKETTFTLSYGWVTQPMAVSFKPRNEAEFYKGPLQSMTTQRHDFTAKTGLRPDKCAPKVNVNLNNAKFEDKTVMTESYARIENYNPAVSCKPEIRYSPPDCPLESRTTQQLSYQPNQIPPKEILPWALKPQYMGPESPFVGNTIYSGSYLAPGTFEEIECPPEENKGKVTCFCNCPRATEGL